MRPGKCSLHQFAAAIGAIAVAVAAASPGLAIRVTPATAQVVKRAIAQEKGHVVVVNFWATWCVPCCEEYPSLVKLQRTYARKGVTVIGVSADEKSSIATKVVPFLKQQKAYFPQYLQQYKDPAEYINAFDPSWQGDLPRTFVYDRQGHLAKTLSDSQTYAQFVAAVTPLLGPR